MLISIVKGVIKAVFKGGKKELSVSKVSARGYNTQSLNCVAPGFEISPANGEYLIITQLEDSPSFLVAVGGVNQNIEPDTDRGERRIYSVSTDGQTIKAVAKFKNDGTLELNGASSFAVKYDELETVLTAFKNAVNLALASKLDGGGTAGTITLDISTAKSSNIKLS